MRLSEYPYVVVRIACSKCARKGQYRLARLAERHGAEIGLPHLIEALSAGCNRRDGAYVAIYDRCGAFYPDLKGPRPPDMPPGVGAPRLRVVEEMEQPVLKRRRSSRD